MPTTVVRPGDVAVGYFNRDGLLDFVVTDSQNPSLEIFLQQPFPPGGYASATLVTTGGIPVSIKVADVNHDGNADFLVALKSSATQGEVFLGDGVGGVTTSFPLITVANSDAGDIVSLDVDRDGLLDVVVSDVSLPATRGMYVFRGNGDGTFQAPLKAGSGPYGSLAVLDLNEDGILDIAASTSTNTAPAPAIETLLGTGTFAPPPPFNSVFGIGGVGNNPLPAFNTLAAGDFNHDGHADVAIATSTQVGIYPGLGNGQLTSAGSFALPSGALSLQAGDVNHDGDLDLVFITPAPAGSVGVMLGNGAGGFSPAVLNTFPPGGDGVAVALGDVNGDGRPEVLAANRLARSVGILLNTFGGGCPAASFGPTVRTFAAPDPRSLATGDFNGDGRHDLVSAGTGGNTVTVLLASSTVSFPGEPSAAPGFAAPANLSGFSSPRAVAVARFTNDGVQDLAVANGGTATVSILAGNGTGGFAPVGLPIAVGTTPVAIGVGDFNDDNKRDLAVVNQSSNDVSIRLGNGDGTFVNGPADVGVGTGPVAIRVADFNLDGRPDLAVANFGANSVSIRMGGGAGSFTGTLNIPVGMNPNSLDVGDFNLDGRPDLVVANQGSSDLSILTGNGDGNFTAAGTVSIGASPGAVVVTRLNGDGQPDLVATLPGQSSVHTFLGSGPATFAFGNLYYVGASATSLAEGDVTQDGRPDVLVGIGGTWNYVAVLTSLGTGALAIAPSSTEGGPGAVAASDFDRDGDLDLVFGNESGSLSFQKNMGNGTFTPSTVSSTAPSVQPRILAVADFNRDGKDDLAAGFLFDPVRTFRGDGAGGFTAFAPITPVFAAGLAVADFDLDGKADLVVARKLTNQALIMLGDGAGAFGTPLSFTVLNSATGVAVGDFDRNGLTDFAVSHDPDNRLAIFLNFYDFTPPFRESHFLRVSPDPIAHATRGVLHIAAGDFNHDGFPDLVVDDTAGGIEILAGDGSGRFASIAVAAGDAPLSSLAAVDLNQDGNLDVVATSPSLNSTAVWVGGPSGPARPVYYTSSHPAGAADAQPQDVAVGDYDGDGKPDLAVANTRANGFSIYTNTNCASRRLAMITEVSACNAPNVPFFTQPRVGIMDDGGNVNACETGNVTASIAPGTGTAGALLIGPPLTIPATAGIAAYTNLKVDLAGRKYRLNFAFGPLSALSRTFSQGLSVAISGGPLDLCLGQPVNFSAGAGYDSYTWTLDPPATPFSFSPNVSLTTLGVGLHSLQVVVEQDSCTATDVESPNVNPDLSSVTITTPGPTVVCTTCTGGLVTESHVGGGAILGRQWQFAFTSGGPYFPIPGQNGATYSINGADFPGPGGYFLALRTLPSCGSPVVSNEVGIGVVASVPSDVVRFFTVTSANAKNTLEWVNAPGRNTVRIRFNSGPTSCTFPFKDDGSDGSTFLINKTGPMGSRDAHVHTGAGVLNDTKYCYTIFQNLGGPFGPGRSNSGRPFSTAGRVQWAFNIGTTSLVPPGSGPGVVQTVAMDNSLHTELKGAGGGTWPSSPLVWMPQELFGPSHGRPSAIPFPAGGANRLIFLGDEVGFVHAINGETGSQVWVTASPLGIRIVAGISGIFKVFSGFDNQLLVGTHNIGAENTLYALDPANGNVLWSYDGDDGVMDNGRIGIISGQPTVDYVTKRVYFASRAFGGAPDNNTVWCVSLTDGKACWAKAYGDIDGSLSLVDTRLFVGTNAGTVRAINASDGTDAWSGAPLVTGDGNVRGYVAPNRLNGDIYFSTASRVWRVQGMGASPSVIWSVPFTSPSTPTYAPGDSVVYVGGDGRLFELNVGDGSVADSIVLGDGSGKVGSPTLDLRAGFAYVGTVGGIVYGTRIP